MQQENAINGSRNISRETSIVPEYTNYIPPPCNEAVQTLYVDQDIIVVVKPAGLLSVPGRLLKDCVVNRLIYDYPEVVVVHRLDLDTSGLLVLALSRLARSELNRQFRERRVKKQYIALVYGAMHQDRGQIDLPIAPDPDNRPRQKIDFATGKQSLTEYEVLARDVPIPINGVNAVNAANSVTNIATSNTRLLLKPVTGRSHQLRIHLASIGFPILGCDLYAHATALNAVERLCLHASQLEFDHPATGEQLVFNAPVPY